MIRPGTDALPLAPLLHAYTLHAPTAAALVSLPDLGPRFAAIGEARSDLLAPAFLESAGEATFRDALSRFYQAVVNPPLHAATLQRRAGIVRHALAMLLHGRQALPLRLEQCLHPGGAYFVPGLGPTFWSALVQGLDPERHPGWTPAIVSAVRRLGLAKWAPGAGPAVVYGHLLNVARHLIDSGALPTALHVDHFLTRVARTTTRTLAGDEAFTLLEKGVERLRAGGGLREQLKQRGQILSRGQRQLEQALARCDGPALLAVLGEVDPDSVARAPLDAERQAEPLILWVGRLWETPVPALPTVLVAFWQADPIPGAGLWLPPAVLHLRDPQQFSLWSEAVRVGYARLDDGASAGNPAGDYALFCEGAAWLREHLTLHPLEVSGYLAGLGPETASTHHPSGTVPFGGFGPDTFAFLAELTQNNDYAWMSRQRTRYGFSIRQPLVELCRALVTQYVAPVLCGRQGWKLDIEPLVGHALTSICRNAYGRGGTYTTDLWITFCPPGRRTQQPQLFIRLDASGVRFGLRLGPRASAALTRLRANLTRHSRWIFAALETREAFADSRFGLADHATGAPPTTHEGLLTWAKGKSCEVSWSLPAADPLLLGEGLVGAVLLGFDRLLPLLAATLEEDAEATLQRLGVTRPEAGAYTTADFLRATNLAPGWLERARGLLEMKKQLILQGVPGTGKTHVARCLARLLTSGRDECTRLVQFHPAYTYEEFVEGIKVRTVERDGRQEPTYPVEEGLLCAFAEQAAAFPAKPHVLIIDEINRGNLPRIFGELLYLLEYREQAVVLPYSRRRFQLPGNLFLLGTMNAADRSVALIDQALRRRFSFLEMAPDGNILAEWLRTHPPSQEGFADRVLDLFEKLNARLAFELGPTALIGHSVFMVPKLDEEKLALIWAHHVLPLVQEQVAGRPERLAAFTLERIGGEPRRGRTTRV